MRYGNEVALLLGCIEINVDRRLTCLRNVSAFALSMVEFEDGVISQPVVDGSFADNPFLPTYVETSLKEGSFATDVDVLLGANLNEGLLFTQLILGLPTSLEFFTENWSTWGPILLLQKKYLEITDDDIALADDIFLHYCGSKNVTMDNIDQITDMFTDAFFWYGMDKYLDYHIQHSSGNIFQYINKHINDYGQIVWLILSNFTDFVILQMIWMSGVGDLPGVSHADELWIEFFGHNANLTVDDTAVSKHLTSMWSNFVKFGDPTPPGGEFAWKPISQDRREYLVLGPQLRMERSVEYVERMAFWREILP